MWLLFALVVSVVCVAAQEFQGDRIWCFLAFYVSVFVMASSKGRGHVCYYILPSLPYLVLPIAVLLLSGRSNAGAVGFLLLVAFWALVAGFNLAGIFGRKIDILKIPTSSSQFSVGFLWFSLLCGQLLIVLLAFLQEKSPLLLAISLVAKQLILFCLAVGLVNLSRYGFLQVFCYLLFCGAFFFLRDFGSDEVSRFQYAQLLYQAILLLTFMGRIKESSMVALTIVGGVIAIVVSALLPGVGGGDALILLYVDDVMSVMRDGGHTEPLMFFHNMGLMYLPDSLWFSGHRPKLYNPSAWYLSQVMGLDPSSYPWGVGLAGVGAAFLQGGIIGVILIYSSVGFVFRYFLGAYMGFTRIAVVLYMASSLSFAMFRMDASFLFGPAFITLPMIAILARYFDWWDTSRLRSRLDVAAHS